MDIEQEYWMSKNDLLISINTIMDIHKYLWISMEEFLISNIFHEFFYIEITFMDIHNSSINIHNSFMDMHNSNSGY